jgi:hypothetical protein
MKKKRLNEGCASEGEETTPKHAEFISVDQVNRYMLQMTDEEQDTMSFRDVIAGILRTKPENIKSMKRSGLGWRVKAVGDMDDITYTPDNLDDDFMLDDEEEESEWMTPEEMGIAQKIDWSDDMGDDISDDEKMAYFQSKSDMYDVDMENGLVRLKPEDDWFDSEDDMEDWEREGYNSEIAYQNRWRDYED